jgi:voltage-gated potassium channel
MPEGTPRIGLDRFRFARVEHGPLHAIWQRVLFALILIALVGLITYIGRDGYYDNSDGGSPDLLGSFYYATVSVTTTGYGDIVPVSSGARLVNTVLVTPARVLFLILLVGTTLEVLASRSRLLYKLRHWQEGLSDHVVICGFGVKGRSALSYLRGNGYEGQVVVIDTDTEALEAANAMGCAGVIGTSSDREVLAAACIEKAKRVIIATRDDDVAVLTTLRVRELNPRATIIASCREEENVDLLDSSGADEVVVSSASAGRILGMAAEAPAAARVINDLLTSGEGLDIEEREVRPGEIGLAEGQSEAAIAVLRDNRILRLNDPDLGTLQAGDHIISITEQPPSDPPQAQH